MAKRSDWKKGKRQWSVGRWVGLRFDDEGTIFVQSGPKLYGKPIKGGKLSVKRIIGKWK